MSIWSFFASVDWKRFQEVLIHCCYLHVGHSTYSSLKCHMSPPQTIHRGKKVEQNLPGIASNRAKTTLKCKGV